MRREVVFAPEARDAQYDYFRQVGAGGGSTKGALTCAFLRSVRIPFPPTLQEQQEVVSILDALDRKIELHRRKRAVLDELFKALLHKLMTGEIEWPISTCRRSITPLQDQPSFPRKRESRGPAQNRLPWTPASAGVTKAG